MLANLKIAAERPQSLITALADIWEASVAATHNFLSPGDIEALKPEVRSALGAIPMLVYAVDAHDSPLGFMGLDGGKIEMLFLDPACRGCGLGRRFIEYALQEQGAEYVDVNEQNIQAAEFYEHLGFWAFKRSEYDGQGRPFPILHMKISGPEPLPHGYSLRPARPEQFEALNAIEIAAASIFPPGIIPEQFLSDHVPLDVLAEAQKNGLLWVALDEAERPVGYALLQIADGFALLAQVDVHPKHGRKGLGRALIGRVAAQARELGQTELYLSTFGTVPWNAPFYQKLGFKVLEPAEQPEFMLKILQNEAAFGLKNRVAMRLALAAAEENNAAY